jgi:CheY-like chemotaxis protein
MLKVLVVEDDSDLMYLYQTALGQNGCQITQASYARDAIFELSQHTFDAIILDLNLPDAYGGVVIDFILQDGTHRVDQVIVITATDNWSEEMGKRGVQNVILKPISMNQVVDAIRQVAR